MMQDFILLKIRHKCVDLLKLKYRRGDKIIQPFCRNGFPQEIRSPLLNFEKSSRYDKSNAESYRIQSNLMNDKKFGSFNF